MFTFQVIKSRQRSEIQVQGRRHRVVGRGERGAHAKGQRSRGLLRVTRTGSAPGATSVTPPSTGAETTARMRRRMTLSSSPPGQSTRRRRRVMRSGVLGPRILQHWADYLMKLFVLLMFCIFILLPFKGFSPVFLPYEFLPMPSVANYIIISWLISLWS